MNYYDILNELKSQNIGHIYLFNGEEGWLKNDIITRMKRVILGDIKKENINFTLFYGDDFNATLFLTTCNTIPFLNERRLVLVRNAHLLKEEQKKSIIMYCNEPALFTILIIEALKLSKEDIIYKTIDYSGKVVEFPLLFESQVLRWINNYTMRRMKKKITGDGAKLLLELVGNNLCVLSTELEKINNYVGEKDFIDENEIRMASGEFSHENIFDLLDAVGRRDANTALGILKDLLMDGEHPLKILFMLERQFRLIWQWRLLKEKGILVEEINKQLMITSKRAKITISTQATRYTKTMLFKFFEEFYQTDLNLKSQDSRLHPLLIELLVLRCIQC